MQLEELLRRVFVSPYSWLYPPVQPVEVCWISTEPRWVEPGDVFLSTTQAPPARWEQAVEQGAVALILIGQEPPRPWQPPVPTVWVRTPHGLSTVYRHLLRTLLQPVERFNARALFWMLAAGEISSLGNLRLALEQLGLRPEWPYHILRVVVDAVPPLVARLRSWGWAPPQGLVDSIRPGEVVALFVAQGHVDGSWPDPRSWFGQVPQAQWALTRAYAWTEWPHAFQRAGMMLEIVQRLPLLSGLEESEAQPFLWLLEHMPAHVLERLAHQVLAPLARHPEGETLLLSLEALFLHHNLSQAARALYIHRNTLRQRLERVALLTGYHYDNPHHLWLLRMAWFGYRWTHPLTNEQR